jgi:hypothetical protein
MRLGNISRAFSAPHVNAEGSSSGRLSGIWPRVGGSAPGVASSRNPLCLRRVWAKSWSGVGRSGSEGGEGRWGRWVDPAHGASRSTLGPWGQASSRPRDGRSRDDEASSRHARRARDPSPQPSPRGSSRPPRPRLRRRGWAEAEPRAVAPDRRSSSRSARPALRAVSPPSAGGKGTQKWP